MKVRRVDFSPDEWLAGTAELSDEDRGVYITICALIYSRGQRVEYAVLKAHSRSHGNKLLASLDRLEKAEKIVRNGSEIGQKRSENELEKAQIRLGKRLENLTKANDPNHIGSSAASSDSRGRETINHQPSTTITTPNGVDTATAVEGGLDLKSFVFREGLSWLSSRCGEPPPKLRPLLGRWCKDHGDGAVIEAIFAAQREQPADPKSWIIGHLQSIRRPRSRGSGVIGGVIPMHPGAGG